MRGLDKKDKDQVVNIKQVEQKIRQVLFHDTLKRGHSVFEIDPATMTCEFATIESEIYINLKKKKYTKSRVKVQLGRFYICALNKDNAMKKFLKEYTKEAIDVFKEEQESLRLDGVPDEIMRFAYCLLLEHKDAVDVVAMELAGTEKFKDAEHSDKGFQKHMMWLDIEKCVNHIIEKRKALNT